MPLILAIDFTFYQACNQEYLNHFKGLGYSDSWVGVYCAGCEL